MTSSPDTERAELEESESGQVESTDNGQRRRRLRRTAAVLGTVLLVAAVIPFVVFAVPQVVGADHGFVILSGSMEPNISPGDVVIVDGSRSVEVGDIVTFEDESNIPTTHRVVSVENGAYVTQGDANEEPDDQPVDPDRVLGEVVVTIPYIGYIIVWVNSPLGYLALVAVPLALLLGTELLAWVRRNNESTNDDESIDDESTDDDVSDTPDSDEPTTPLRPAVRRLDDRRSTDDRRESRLEGGPNADKKSDDDPAANKTEAKPETVAVAVADLKLSVLATGVLFAYAGWHVSLALTAGSAPNPVSVGAMTAGLLGLVLAGWVTVSAWRVARRERTPTTEQIRSEDAAPEDTAPHMETDGGTEEKEP